VKRQFVQFTPSKGNSPSRQLSTSTEELFTNDQPDAASAPFDQSALPASPAPYPAKPTEKGLLSSWKNHNPQTLLSEKKPVSAGLEDQDTAIHQAVQRPTTGPMLNPGNVPGQMSPYQSGMTPFATLYASVQSPAAPLPTRPQPPQPYAAPNLPPITPYSPLPPSAMPPGPFRPMNVPNSFGYPSSPVQMMQAPVTTQLANRITPLHQGSKKKRFPIWARIAVAILAFLLVVGGSAYGYYQANYADAINNITGHKAIHQNQSTKDGDTTTQSDQVNSGDVLSGQRINILLLGSDTDGKNGNDIQTGTPLAQTDIIVTIDPQTKYVGMLSIPRDLQVTIPSTANDKLDKAFMYGVKGNGVAERVGSGAGLSEDTIKYNFGIDINYYAWVDIYGFVKVIDTAGGVDVDATHPMVDDVYPDDVNNQSGHTNDYKRLYIAPGPQHMNGLQALEYVRTRHSDLVGDFGRSARQQQILSQLKTKLATPGIIGKAPELLKDLNGAIQTDMQLDQIIQIANLARDIDPNKIDRITLGPPTYAGTGGTSGNYFPICAPIQDEIAKMFALGDKARCLPQANSGSSDLASIAQPASMTTSAQLQPANQTTQISATSLKQQDNLPQQDNTGISGIHSLLDLLFMIVFESFDAARV